MLPELEAVTSPPDGIWISLRTPDRLLGAYCPTRTHASAVAEVVGLLSVDRICFVMSAYLKASGRVREGTLALAVFADGLAEAEARIDGETMWLNCLDSWMIDAARRGWERGSDPELAVVYMALLGAGGVGFL